MQAGGGEAAPPAGEETTVEDLLRVVRQLPQDAEIIPVSFRFSSWMQLLSHDRRLPRDAAHPPPDAATSPVSSARFGLCCCRVTVAERLAFQRRSSASIVAIQAVARGLRYLDSRALAALLKELAKVLLKQSMR